MSKKKNNVKGGKSALSGGGFQIEEPEERTLQIQLPKYQNNTILN